MKTIGEFCPDCNFKLHKGQHKFKDGPYFVISCKKCGFRYEEPIYKKEYTPHIRRK